MTSENKPPPPPVRCAQRDLIPVLTMLIAVAVMVALGLEINQWWSGANPAVSMDSGPTIPISDEARELPTTSRVEGIPMIKTEAGTMVSLRAISVREFQQFADETGLPDSSYAWIHYNWGWEWKKGYSWRFPGDSHAPGDQVTAISLQDAQAFCRWLTDREHARGTLPPGQFYRVIDADKVALLQAAQEARQASIRDGKENLAPGFHIELVQNLAPGDT